MGSWVLGFGFGILGFRFWVLGFGFGFLGFGSWVVGFGFWVLGLVFWILGCEFWVCPTHVQRAASLEWSISRPLSDVARASALASSSLEWFFD